MSDLYFGSVDEFVREYLVFVYRRRIDGRNRLWAGKWWEYEEAVIRLDALWRSWERLRHDAATGMSVWWRDHADYHMNVLMDPEGPFAGSAEDDENRSKKGDPLPYVAPPPGLFPDARIQLVDAESELTRISASPDRRSNDFLTVVARVSNSISKPVIATRLGASQNDVEYWIVKGFEYLQVREGVFTGPSPWPVSDPNER
ncbi:MAG: DUF4913 domain-containing protein [Rhodoglobus sp.]